jgi:hypothetical protein
MALVIENGTIIANANSLVTVEEIRESANLRNVSLPADNNLVQAAAIKAMDYIESLESKIQGVRTDEEQTLPFPRTGMTINNISIGINSIPIQAKRAQIQLAIYAANGIDLMPMVTEAAVKSEKVGPLETVYDTENYNLEPELPLAYAWLNLLFGSNSPWSLSVNRA